MAKSRRIYALGALSLCLASSVVGDAGAAPRRSTPRVEVAQYESPALGAFVGIPGPLGGGVWYADCAEAEGAGCVILHIRPGERFAHIEVQDSLGLPVHALVFAPGSSVPFAQVCSRTTHPIEVSSYSELWVDLVAGTCYEKAGLSTPTKGTVVGTFYRSPVKG
jgi:hypothetical protein